MPRAKVLHLITHLGFGGAQDNTLLTVEGLSRDRYEVHLAAGRDHSDWESRGRQASERFFTLPELRRSPSPVDDFRSLRSITDLIRRGGYDIVHTHSAKAGTLGRIAARRAGTPVVIHTFHSFGWQAVADTESSLWERYSAAAKKWFYIQVERYAASLSDALITVCDLNKRQAIDLELAPERKLTTVYSGIDLSRFVVEDTRAEMCEVLGLDPQRPIVGTVGRLATQKAPLDFVRAAQITLEARPDAQFIMVGDGPLADEVERAIGDETRIRVLGYRDDIPAVLSVLDVFAQSSLWEGLGRAATEAMIMEVPVAATAVDGVPELVDDEETGLLSPAGAPDALAHNIVWLLDHPEAAKRMGRRARESVVPLFSAENMVAGIEELYESTLAEAEADAGAAR